MDPALKVAGIAQAISKRDALESAVAALVREFEQMVPRTRVQALQISRKELKSRIGGRYTTMGVIATVTIEGRE